MLYPIENAWGVTKNYIASANDGKDFQAVRGMIADGFGKVSPEIWEKLVDRCCRNEDGYQQHGPSFIEEEEDGSLAINLRMTKMMQTWPSCMKKSLMKLTRKS